MLGYVLGIVIILILSHLTPPPILQVRKLETQRGSITCPKPHSQEVVEPELEPR